MVVARQDGDALSGLPIPDSNRLVIRRAENPGYLMVELNGSDVVQVTQ